MQELVDGDRVLCGDVFRAVIADNVLTTRRTELSKNVAAREERRQFLRELSRVGDRRDFVDNVGRIIGEASGIIGDQGQAASQAIEDGFRRSATTLRSQLNPKIGCRQIVYVLVFVEVAGDSNPLSEITGVDRAP